MKFFRPTSLLGLQLRWLRLSAGRTTPERKGISSACTLLERPPSSRICRRSSASLPMPCCRQHADYSASNDVVETGLAPSLWTRQGDVEEFGFRIRASL